MTCVCFFMPSIWPIMSALSEASFSAEIFACASADSEASNPRASVRNTAILSALPRLRLAGRRNEAVHPKVHHHLPVVVEVVIHHEGRGGQARHLATGAVGRHQLHLVLFRDRLQCLVSERKR